MNTLKILPRWSLLVVLLITMTVPAYAMKASETKTPEIKAPKMKAPEQVVRETVDTIVSNIQKNRTTYEGNTNALYEMIERTLVPALHIPRMSNAILGREHSRKATDTQKQAFSEEFKTLLMRSYATALLEYTGDEKVIYEPVNIPDGANKVVVKAALVSSAGDRYPIHLFMSNRKDTQWRAYNMEVAGINFISTYRATFGGIIASKGIDALIADLRAKNSK